MNNNDKSLFFSTKKTIKKWLDKNYINNYTINNDLSVDVSGHVDISNENLERIPVKFNNITGNFWCQYNKLISLSGSPETVGGYFDCSNNHLISIAGSPTTVGGGFSCGDNPLTSLDGSPESVGGSFFCVKYKSISLIELNRCSFKEKIYFNIDEKNFQQKELIKELKKYYHNERDCYVLSNNEFRDIIKPQIEKEFLQQKLIDSKIKNKTRTRTSFL